MSAVLFVLLKTHTGADGHVGGNSRPSLVLLSIWLLKLQFYNFKNMMNVNQKFDKNVIKYYKTLIQNSKRVCVCVLKMLNQPMETILISSNEYTNLCKRSEVYKWGIFVLWRKLLVEKSCIAIWKKSFQLWRVPNITILKS